MTSGPILDRTVTIDRRAYEELVRERNELRLTVEVLQDALEEETERQRMLNHKINKVRLSNVASMFIAFVVLGVTLYQIIFGG